MTTRKRPWWADETPISLAKARKLFPSQPCIATVRKWRTQGYRKIKLRCYRSGVLLMTTVEAVERFLARISKED
jgi:hypothetical protein